MYARAATSQDLVFYITDFKRLTNANFDAPMIVYNLSCDNEHRFEGWFESAEKFELQRDLKQVNCPVCGTDQVVKELHAPYVNTGSEKVAPGKTGVAQPNSEQAAVFHRAIGRLVEEVLANTEDVGNAFPEEARKIHYSEAPERAIRGNASADEVSELREEGIDVFAVPLPKHRVDKPH